MRKMSSGIVPLCAATVTCGWAMQGVQAQRQHPHIILIMTDQHRADALGCTGNETVISPYIDQLAADGYVFSNAYTAAPSSTPARATLLTGMIGHASQKHSTGIAMCMEGSIRRKISRKLWRMHANASLPLVPRLKCRAIV